MKTILALTFATLLAAGQARAQDAPEGGPPPPSAQTESTRLHGEVISLYAAGKFAEALPLASRAVELKEKELGPSHPQVGAALVNLAAVERNLGKSAESRKHYERAAEIFEKGGDESARSLITAVEGLARLESDIFRVVVLHKRILALKEKAYGPESPAAGLSLFQLGHFNDLLRDYGAAERYFQRFLRIAEKTGARAEDDIAVAYTRLGCLMRKKGEGDEAAAYESKADAAFKSAADKRPPVESGVVNGKALSKPQPSYPAEAKRASADGTIQVEILIGESGAVLSACAQRGEGHKSLKESSEFAAYNARFTPTTVGGRPVKVRGVITYRFVLQR